MDIHTLLKASGNGVPCFCTQALLCSALGSGESRLGSWGGKARLLTPAWSVRAQAMLYLWSRHELRVWITTHVL